MGVHVSAIWQTRLIDLCGGRDANKCYWAAITVATRLFQVHTGCKLSEGNADFD